MVSVLDPSSTTVSAGSTAPVPVSLIGIMIFVVFLLNL